MFGSLVQKLQSLSPLTSPTTSPAASPKARRRRFGFGGRRRGRGKDPSWREEVREVQSEPELDYDVPSTRRGRGGDTTPRKTSAPLPATRKWSYGIGVTVSPPQQPPIYDVPARIRRRRAVGGFGDRQETPRTVGRVEGMRESERLSEYDQYFTSLLVDNRPDCGGDYAEVNTHQHRVAELVAQRTDDLGELERIQELFPNDNLRLHDRDPVAQRMKGLMRKRSATAARLQRAFSAKGLRTPDHNNTHNNHNNNNNNSNNKDDAYNDEDNDYHTPTNNNNTKDKPKRQFIMETPVQFTTGVQSQERHLFLFSDLLLVAKARSGGNFKLKEKVRVSELWLATCVDDVAEVPKSAESSFVVGWPTTNVVASFSCVATKDLWFSKLTQVLGEEREKEPPTIDIQVTYFDPVNNTDICKTVSVSSTTTARECVSLTLARLNLPCSEASRFQLWVRNTAEEAPYPLIGHELPFALQMNCLREAGTPDQATSTTIYSTEQPSSRCHFILRQERPPVGAFASPDAHKKASKKARKSPIRIHRVFRRANSKGDVTDGGTTGRGGNRGGVLFGRPLQQICGPDGTLPKPVMDMLQQLFQKGPFTVGIFRKSANARLVGELKDKLDRGEEPVDLESVHITAVAALLKDFLRSLPDAVLTCHLYEEWLLLGELSSTREKVSHSLLLCDQMPRPHLVLLQHFLCVLHHIARRASENKMSASNLAVCVAPSTLWPSSPILALSPEASKQAPAVIEFLIDKCCLTFGREVLMLLGEAPDQDPLRQDSGAEESDSLHSSGGMRRDDSSIDSLERELLGEGELSPLPRKDKMSLTNLSRDSGLTMSDSQLYTPDEEESESTSSGHSGEKAYPQQPQDRQNDRFQHYAAPNNPNAIYTAIYRRPDKVSSTYDEPDNHYAAPNRDHTRVHITYSSPSYSYGINGTTEYTPVYQSRHDRLANGFMREEEAIYSVPGNTSNPRQEQFIIHSNFQRHDWMRRRSNLRKKSRSGSENGLVRSTSEESLLNKYNAQEYGISLGPSGVPNPIEFSSRDQILPPPPVDYDDSPALTDRDSPLRRSKSAHQIVEKAEGKNPSIQDQKTAQKTPTKDSLKWHRSRSTPHIHDEGDRSYDSSTLSDDDSTPHVSRSNSRGKEYGGGSSLHAWDDPNTFTHASDSGDSHASRHSSFKSERTGSVCTVVSAGSTSTLSSNPPSYEEALSRRSYMHHQGYDIREDKMKSARAKQLYEESLRIYQEENTYPSDLVRASPAHAHDSDDPERPPPLPPKSEPPPLPPKQKAGRRSSEGGGGRLKHLPPVHVELSPRKTPYHRTIIYTDDSPPSVPPKERTVIEVESAYIGRRDGVEKKSIETQTDECDLLDDEDDSLPPPSMWEQHVTSVAVPDPSFRDGRWRGRVRRRDSSTSQRSRSMPNAGREAGGRYVGPSESESESEEEWEGLEGGHDFPRGGHAFLRDLKQLDPELQQEISWSVSRLRAIFGESLNGAKVHPPPYRPPPSAHRTPITSYHLGAGDSFTCRSNHSSNYSEESYV